MENIIKKTIRKFYDKTFIIDGKKEVRYGNLFSVCKLRLNFIKPEDLIVVVAENSLSFFQIYFYALQNNIPQILIEKNMQTESLKKILKLYKPNYVFLRDDNKIELGIPKKRFNGYVIFNYSNKKININNKLAILLSTSGTTGSSKFVKLSYENIFNNAINIAKYLKIQRTHTTITTMSPSYSYGLSIINSHFIKGAKVIVNNDTFFSQEFWRKINHHKITSFGGVPFHYEILKKLKIHRINFKYLKYLTQAGGALDENILKYLIGVFKKKKIDFIQMYGQTEASPRISYLPFSMAGEKFGSIGKVIPGGKMYLRKNKKQKIGEIIYEGKNVFIGYSSGRKDLKNKIQKKKVLETGDLAWVDEDGYFYVVGRKDRLIKVAGLRINLDEIKTFLNKENIKAELIKKNEKIYIFTNTNLSKDEILYSLSKKIKLNKNFFEISKVKSFPKNFRDKINYNKLIKNDTH